MIKDLNYTFYSIAKNIHDLICYYYKGGSTFDTAFWKYAKEYAIGSLNESSLIKELDSKLLNEYYKKRLRPIDRIFCLLNNYLLLI